MKRHLVKLCLIIGLLMPLAGAFAAVIQEPVEPEPFNVEKHCLQRAANYCNQPPFNQDQATYEACVTAYAGICVDAHNGN